MICKKPFMKGDIPFGCGQCLPCRMNRRRLWTHRIILEALKHEQSCFLTLTYSDEYLPENGSLESDAISDFIKRLRSHIKPFRIRFYGVGEYGDESERPHYHLAVFGLSTDCHSVVTAAWPYGHIMVGTLTMESAQYIAGYVTKKLTNPNDPRLNGRYPEYARMSLKPGIGTGALEELAEFFQTEQGKLLLDKSGDVPLTLRHGGREWPLGRYLRSKLREILQIPEVPASENPYIKQSVQEMSAMYDASKARTKWQKLATYQKSIRPKVRSIEGRSKIFKKDKPL